MGKYHIAWTIAAYMLSLPGIVWGQPTSDETRAFSSENAIIDTALPFVIGAIEAKQELRSSFGWATYQEGQVNGIYFRFDPDGYARFSPTPRLDTDVFEVICQPGTSLCKGRKKNLSVQINAKSQVKFEIEGFALGDQIFLVDGVEEIELTEILIQPLSPVNELRLRSDGDISIRRGNNEIDRISLKGFSALVTYLKWVFFKQDYSALPSDWPIERIMERGQFVQMDQNFRSNDFVAEIGEKQSETRGETYGLFARSIYSIINKKGLHLKKSSENLGKVERASPFKRSVQGVYLKESAGNRQQRGLSIGKSSKHTSAKETIIRRSSESKGVKSNHIDRLNLHLSAIDLVNLISMTNITAEGVQISQNFNHSILKSKIPEIADHDTSLVNDDKEASNSNQFHVISMYFLSVVQEP